MAFLTIAGITVRVSVGAAVENDPVRIGAESRAFAGNLRSTVQDEKRQWTFTTALYTQANLDTLRAAIAEDAQVACAGDALGAAFTCRVRMTQGPFIKVAGGFRRTATLQISEV